MAQMMERDGRVDQVPEFAERGERLGALTGAVWAEESSSLHLANAGILGVDVGERAESRMARGLETSIRTGVGVRLGYLLNTAARPLVAAGKHELAALCLSVPMPGPFDSLPRLALDDVSAEVWEQAASDATDLTPFDIARLAADGLKAIIESDAK